jgi:hypothetical protein
LLPSSQEKIHHNYPLSFNLQEVRKNQIRTFGGGFLENYLAKFPIEASLFEQSELWSFGK